MYRPDRSTICRWYAEDGTSGEVRGRNEGEVYESLRVRRLVGTLPPLAYFILSNYRWDGEHYMLVPDERATAIYSGFEVESVIVNRSSAAPPPRGASADRNTKRCAAPGEHGGAVGR